MTDPWLVAIDLDGSVFQGERNAADFAAWWESDETTKKVVYASQLSWRGVREFVIEKRLPLPEAIIAGMGTEICLCPEDRPLLEWQSRWWSAWSTADVDLSLCRKFDLRRGPTERQSQFRKSFVAVNATPESLRSLRSALRSCGMEAQHLGDDDSIDVTPLGATKGAACEFLACRWQIPKSRVVVAGDSQSARSLFVQGFHGIVYGDAYGDLALRSGRRLFSSPSARAVALIEGLESAFATGSFWQPPGEG